jgi:hypothetical protein
MVKARPWGGRAFTVLGVVTGYGRLVLNARGNSSSHEAG